MESKEQKNREKIVLKFIENPGLSGRKIAKSLNLPPRTVTDVINRYKDSLTVARKPRTGPNHNTINKKLFQKITKSVKENPGLSDNQRAVRYGTSVSTGRRYRLKAGLKSYRVIKQPNRSEKQSKVAKKRARLLYNMVLTKNEGCLMMDDETYVKCDFRQLPGQKFYVSQFRGNVLPKYKYVLQDKYAKKMMIWQTICSCGKKSRSFVTNATMTSDLYVKECLQKRLLPFIRSHNCRVVFWPDLASCHYAKSTMAWYEKNGVEVLTKNMNPPNCPQLRPIEIFWAIVKRSLKKNGGASKDIASMTKKWNQHAGNVSEEVVQKLMAGIKKKTRLFIRSSEL